MIVGVIALTLQFQNVMPELHRSGEASPGHSATLPQAGPGV